MILDSRTFVVRDKAGQPAALEPDWDWQHPASESNDLNDVWAASPTDLFAAGDEGMVLHHNEDRWQQMGTTADAILQDVWGFAPDDVYAVGLNNNVHHCDGSGWARMGSIHTRVKRF